MKTQREIDLEQKRLTAVQEEEANRASMSQENGGEGPSPSRKASATPVIRGPTPIPKKASSSQLVPPRKTSLGNLRAEIKRTQEMDSYWNERARNEDEVLSRRDEAQNRLENHQVQEPPLLLVGSSDDEVSLTPPSTLDLNHNEQIRETMDTEEAQETVDEEQRRRFYSVDEPPEIFGHQHSRSTSGKERGRNSSTLVEELSPAPSSTLLPFVNPNLEGSSPSRPNQESRRPWDQYIPPHLRETAARGEMERLKDTIENLAELEVSTKCRCHLS